MAWRVARAIWSPYRLWYRAWGPGPPRSASAPGRRVAFDLPIELAGTEFQRRGWAQLLDIPCGQTRSYGWIAQAVGSSARAVGRANATNPVCVIVPCHRVIGADGSLTGFAFGEETKRRLLALERGGV